ncbi:MAG: SoxR reducing system RseC family protein [Nitrospirae bacterium]|nr:SoxR reducing system RseC family protein [Nitrospirota bacterium]
MEEVGVVKSIEGMIAKVSVPRKSVCEGCTAGTCKPDEQSMEIEAINKAKAKVGQRVKVIVKTYTYLSGSIIVYGIPALALITGAIIGKEVFSSQFKDMDPDIISAIFGFGAFLIAFLVIKIWSMTASKKTESKPVIEEILE